MAGVLVACDVDSQPDTKPVVGDATLPEAPDPELPLVSISISNAGAVQLLGVIHLESMTAVARSPIIADQLAIGYENGTILIISLLDRNDDMTLKGHTAAVRTLSYTIDGNMLYSADDDGNVRLWDIEDGTLISAFDSGDEAVTILGLSPLGDRLAFAGDDRMVHVWTASGDDELSTLSKRDSTIRSLSFNPLGTLLAAGSRDGSIQLFRVRSQSVAHTFVNNTAVTALTFFNDGQTLISGDFDGVVRAWDTTNQTSVMVDGKAFELRGADSAVRRFAFSADQRILAVGHDDGTVVMWDFENGAELNRDIVVSNNIADVTLLDVMFLQNDQIIAAVTSSGQIWMWGPEPGAFPTETPIPTDTPTATVTSTATQTLEPTDTLAPSDTPENTDTPEASDTPDVETTPTLEPSQTTTSGPTVTLNASLIPTATRTLSPTPTPETSPTPTVSVPDCTVTPLFDNARVRALPSVNAEQVGRILLGESAAVDSQALGSAGEVWWHIVELDGWVRFDTVAADDGCENVPLVEVGS